MNFGEIPCEIEPGIPGQEPGHLGKLTGSRRGKPASAAISAVPGMRAGVSADLGDWIQNPP